jgi:hypothetical protein
MTTKPDDPVASNLESFLDNDANYVAHATKGLTKIEHFALSLYAAMMSNPDYSHVEKTELAQKAVERAYILIAKLNETPS